MKVLAPLLSLLLLSCSVVTDTGRHTSGEDIAPDRYCVEFADIFCEANQDCCATPVPLVDCQRLLLEDCSIYDQALASPLTGYDARAAGAYLAEARSLAAACDPSLIEFIAPRNFLGAFINGTVAEGGTCNPQTLIPYDYASVISCRRGLTCLQQTALLYTCQPPGGEGTPCLLSTQCDPSLKCAGATGDTAGTCRRPLENGATCTSAQACASLRCSPATSTCEAQTVDSAFCGGDL